MFNRPFRVRELTDHLPITYRGFLHRNTCKHIRILCMKACLFSECRGQLLSEPNFAELGSFQINYKELNAFCRKFQDH